MKGLCCSLGVARASMNCLRLEVISSAAVDFHISRLRACWQMYNWLSFCCLSASSKASRHHTAGLLVAWGSMGRLRPEDIPEAAVDFHISSIIEGLLANPSIKSAAASAAAQIGDEPAGALKSAMWRYSGSVNLRKPLKVQCKASFGGSTNSIVDTHNFCTTHATSGAGLSLLMSS